MSLHTRQFADWHRDNADMRDYTTTHDEVVKLLIDLKRNSQKPKRVDWRDFLDDIEDQQSTRAGTAFACADLLKYFERRSSGKIIEPSKLFIYKTTRRLLNWSGDSGAKLRTCWQAIVRCGVPCEEHWPFVVENLDREPDAFSYSSAMDFSTVRYVRLNDEEKGNDETLETLKAYLAGGFPFVFGFSVSKQLMSTADIGAPTSFDRINGGKAAMAVGYDDDRRYRSYRGAFLIRNSWGKEWGEDGYGWIPYAYVLKGLAADFWTILSPQWLDSGEFLRPLMLIP